MIYTGCDSSRISNTYNRDNPHYFHLVSTKSSAGKYYHDSFLSPWDSGSTRQEFFNYDADTTTIEEYVLAIASKKSRRWTVKEVYIAPGFCSMHNHVEPSVMDSATQKNINEMFANENKLFEKFDHNNSWR